MELNRVLKEGPFGSEMLKNKMEEKKKIMVEYTCTIN